jgi:hypothetical protein
MAEMTWQQYLILSVMAFRGEGVPYATDDLARDVGIVKAWMRDADQRPEPRSDWAEDIKRGYLLVGVVDGRVCFRPSDKDIEPPGRADGGRPA